MKVTVAEVKEFNAWVAKHKLFDSVYIDEESVEWEFSPNNDAYVSALDDSEVIDSPTGWLEWQGKGECPSVMNIDGIKLVMDGASMSKLFSKWRARNSTETVAVRIDKTKLAELKAAVIACGGKIMT